jgi:malate synthase
VAHPDLVPVAAEAFAARGDAVPAAEGDPAALLDTTVAGAAATLAGLRGNLRVALLYLTAWLGGRGAVAIDSLMEDAATAEVARCQVWQWRHHGIGLEDGTVVTAELVSAELDAVLASEEVAALDQDLVKQAGAVLRDVVLAAELPDFLTLAALPLLG